MASEKPKVTVVMPAYNMARYIGPAIRSVQKQTYSDWELLVIDDGSRDATCDIVEKMAAEDARIRLIRNERNIGVAKTRNRGLDLASGKYVALLDSDDLWRREKLAQQVYWAEKTGADVVYCSYGMIDEKDETICDDFLVCENTDFEKALSRIEISCSTALISGNVYANYRFDPEYYHEDLVFWLQILRDGRKTYGIAEVLADYRVHAGTRASNKMRTAKNRWKVYRSCFQIPIGTSMLFFAKYAFLGMKKYRRRMKPEPEWRGVWRETERASERYTNARI